MVQRPASDDRQQQTVSRNSLAAWVTQSLLVVVVPAILLGAFYFVYVVQQQALQSRYLFYVLNNSGQDVRRAIVTRRDNIRKAFSFEKTSKGDPEGVRSDIENRLKLIPEIGTITFFDFADVFDGSENLRKFAVTVDVQVDRTMQTISFHVHVAKQAEDGEDAGRTLASITTPLETLLRQWVSREGLLESIFVARQSETSNEIFLREGRGALGLVSIPRHETVVPEGDRVQDEGSNAGAEIRDITIAGESYKLFMQPFPVPVGIAPEAPADAGNPHNDVDRETVWLTGGLVSNAAFRSRTMAVPPIFVVLAFTTVVAVVLLAPYLRIRFIGKREGLNARDVLLLALTMLLGCSFASLAVAHIWWGQLERQMLARELKSVASRINGQFRQELDALEEALITTVRERTLGESTQAELLNDKRWAWYPHFEMVFGTDLNGMQQWKGSTKSTTTPLINVSDRAYFQHARDDALWLPSEGQAVTTNRGKLLVGRFVESIRSKTTGEEYAILSRRLESAPDALVVAIESKLLSLIEPVLMPPYRFCVINEEGTVQFHSNRRRNLSENFFDSLGSNWEVKSAVRLGASRHWLATYRANPIAAYITPLSGTPWSLIVYSDRRVLANMDLETLTISLAILLLYLTLLVIGGSVLISLLGFVSRQSLPWVARLLNRQWRGWGFLRQRLLRIIVLFHPVRPPAGAAHSMWYWPDPSMVRVYTRLLVVLLITAAAWIVGTLTPGLRWSMALCCFFGPFAAFVFVGGMLVRIRKSAPSLSDSTAAPSSWPRAYAPAVVGVFVTVGVLPPISFYAAVHNAETTAFEDRRQLALAEELRERVERHIDRFQKVRLHADTERRIRDTLKLKEEGNSSIEDALDVHLPTWHVEELEEAPETAAGWQQALRTWLAQTYEQFGHRYGRTFGRVAPTPSYSEYVSESRGLITRQSERLRWPATEQLVVTDWRPSVLPLGKDATGENDDNTAENEDKRVPLHLVVTSPRNFEKLAEGWQLVAIAAVVTCAIIVLLLVCRILRMVFASDVKRPQWIDGTDLLQFEFPRQLRLRFRSQPDSFEPTEEYLRIGFREVETAESGNSLVQLVESELDARGSACEIHLSQFDYGLTDPEIRNKKLDLLEYLATRKNRVVITASIDPMFFLTQQLHDPWLGSPRDISLGRWAAALQDFATLRARRNERELHDRLTAALKEAPDSVWSRLSPEVRSTLVAEGWFNEFLETVARTLCSCQELRDYTADDVIEQFEDAAGAHYRRIWWSCSTDERVLLHRLAEGAFVNWKMKDTVTSLMRRRIIVAAPDFRLMNESFRRFVLRAEPAAVIREWEDAAERSTWKRLGVPLFVFLLFIAVFLIVTQRDVFVQILGVLTMLTAGAPALVRLFSLTMYGRVTESS